MILHGETKALLGYTVDTLAKTSARLGVCNCDICGAVFQRKRGLIKRQDTPRRKNKAKRSAVRRCQLTD